MTDWRFGHPMFNPAPDKGPETTGNNADDALQRTAVFKLLDKDHDKNNKTDE